MNWQDLVKRETVDSTCERMGLIIGQYDQFYKKGVIGECELRAIAKEWCNLINQHNITLVMKDIAFEVAHYLAEQYLAIRQECIDILKSNETSTNL